MKNTFTRRAGAKFYPDRARSSRLQQITTCLWRCIREHRLLLMFVRVSSLVIKAIQRHPQMCKFVQNSHRWFHVRFTRRKHEIFKCYM